MKVFLHLCCMSDFLFAIDGYLSNYQRVSVCDELISQLRKHFPNQKILLLNKHNNSFGLESKVDYYFYYGDGFMVGKTPNVIIEDGRYSRPYVFYKTDAGTLENWLPDVGVTDHVANVFNGFLISSNLGKMFGYERVFRIEYDMFFDDEEILELKNHLEKFKNEDYIIFGKREEGHWKAKHLTQMDLHFCGFSNIMFEGFNVLKNDNDFWSLSDRIQYWGKFTEYYMSMVFETKMKKTVGTEYPGLVRDRFPKSSFDRISSSGLWENRWLDVPAICRISRDNGKTESPDELLLFYRNNDLDFLSFDVKTNFGYKREGKLSRNHWSYEILPVNGDMVFDCLSVQNNKKHHFQKTVNKKNLIELNNRFLIN